MKRAFRQLLRDPTGRVKGGFTLIEVITVISILIILAGILIPSILSVQNRAKRAQTEALFGRIVNALTMYYQDHGGYPAGKTMGMSDGSAFDWRLFPRSWP